MAPAEGSPTIPSAGAELGMWLRDGWWLALRHLPALALIALVAELPLALLERGAGDVDNRLLAFLMGVPAVAVITPLAKAAAIVAIDRWESGERSAIVPALAALVRRFPLLLAGSLLWFLAVAGGVALLVLPGVALLVLGQCLMGAIVLERRSLRDAARRSYALVRPRWFAVLVLFVVVQVAAQIAYGVLEPIVDVVADGLIVDLTVSALTAPLVYAPLAVLFLRSRATADGGPS